MTWSRAFAISLSLAIAGCSQSVAPFSNDTSKEVNEFADKADNWVVLINADQDPTLQIGIMDAARILEFSDNTRIAEMEAYFAPWNPARKIVFTSEYDCSNPRQRLVLMTVMKKTTSFPSPNWQTYPQGHVYETIRQFVCMKPEDRRSIGSLPFRTKGTDDEIAQIVFQKIANTPRLNAGDDPFRH